MFNHRTYIIPAVALLLIAAGLRMGNLNTLPPGFHDDEIMTIRLIETVRRGRIEVFYNVNDEGVEGFFPLVLALTTTVTGKGALGYRMFSVWISIVTLAVVYQLGRRLFGEFAGLLALGLMTFMMWPVLLARQVLPVALAPLSVSIVALAVTRVLLIHQKKLRSNSMSAAVAGVLVGISLYTHPTSLIILFVSILFVMYAVSVYPEIRNNRQRLGYAAFTLTVTLITAIPYIFSSIRRPELAGFKRIFDETNPFIQNIAGSLVGIFIQGTLNPVYNLPGRPLIDFVSGVFVIIGIIICVHYRRRLPFAFALIAAGALLPTAIFTGNAPAFTAYAGILPFIAIFFGLGVSATLNSLRHIGKNYRIAIASLVILFLFNLVWLTRDFFILWRNNEQMNINYHGESGQIARYLDRTAHKIPTMICDQPPNNDNDSTASKLSNTQLIADVMMNRQDVLLRYGDCRTSLIFANGGSYEQIVLTEPNLMETIHPHLREWLSRGQPPDQDNSVPDSVILLDVQEQLADTAGLFTTTSPVRFLSKNAAELGAPVFPPIRFGGNITLLGYIKPDVVVYRVGDRVPLVTYWRAEGVVPPDLTIFTHILRDPVTIAAQRDIISVDPQLLQERDVFIQVTYVDLKENMLEGEYLISIGAYQSQNDKRLSVFKEDGAERDQLFLYPIIVDSAE